MSPLELQAGDIVTHRDGVEFPGRHFVVRRTAGLARCCTAFDVEYEFQVPYLVVVARPLRRMQTLRHPTNPGMRWSTGPSCVVPPADVRHEYVHEDGVEIEWTWLAPEPTKTPIADALARTYSAPRLEPNVTLEAVKRNVRELEQLAELRRAGIVDGELSAEKLLARYPGRPRALRALLIDRLGFERIEDDARAPHIFCAAPNPGGGYLEVRFSCEGERTTRDGETFLIYREEHRRDRAPYFPTPKKLTVAELSRALFETDEDVKAFVAKVADAELAHLRRGVPLPVGAPENSAASFSPERAMKAMQTAWERDERGWRDRAEQRAAGMLPMLKGA